MANDQLTVKQRLFCKYYIIDFNATQAAIKAGYSRKTAYAAASRLLKNVKVQAAIKSEIEAREHRVELSQDRVLQEMALLAFSDMADFFDVEEGGEVKVKKLAELPSHISRQIKSIEENRIIKETKDGDSILVLDKTKFILHDKIRPLIALGNHLGIAFDKLNINGKMKMLHDLGYGMKELAEAYKQVQDGNKPKNRSK